MQLPTCTNTRIRSTADAHALFYAVKLGRLPLIRRRPDAEERLALRSGDVYIWEERSRDSEASSMGRFTEGRRWSESRTREEFFFYYERYRPPPDVARSSSSTGKPEPPPDWEQMVKQTYSVMIDIDGVQKKWHLTAYFTHRTVDGLGTIDAIPAARDLHVPPGLCVSTRTSNKRQKAQRRAAGTTSPHLRSPTSATPAATLSAPNQPHPPSSTRPPRKFAAFSHGAPLHPAGDPPPAVRNPYPAALGTPPPDAPILLTTPTAAGQRHPPPPPPAPVSPAPSSSADSHSSRRSSSSFSSSHTSGGSWPGDSPVRMHARRHSADQPTMMDVDVLPSSLTSASPHALHHHPFADHTNAGVRARPFPRAAKSAGPAVQRARPPSPTRSLAPLRTLERAHPYRRDPADERALRMLVFGGGNGLGTPGVAAAEAQYAEPMHIQGDRRLGIESY